MADIQEMDGVNGKLLISNDFGLKTLTGNPRTYVTKFPSLCLAASCPISTLPFADLSLAPPPTIPYPIFGGEEGDKSLACKSNHASL